MELEITNEFIKFNRNLSDLDKFVLEFVDILNKSKIDYVIISGYVSILFGRARATEDVDVFIEDMDRKKFNEFIHNLKKKGFWIINADNEEAFSMLNDELAIRVAESNKVIPNIEIKIAKSKEDRFALQNKLKIILNNKELFTSKIENQIAYKFYLGSKKDIEDALHLLNLFRGKLDKDMLYKKAKELKVLRELNKYER